MSVQLGFCSFNNLQVAAWKGVTNDDRLFFAQFVDSSVLQGASNPGWTNLGTIPGNSSAGPSLGASAFQNKADTGSFGLFAGWKGESWKILDLSDLRLFFSSLAVPVGAASAASLAPDAWTPQVQIPGAMSFIGPSLAVLDGGEAGNPVTLAAVWPGTSNSTVPGTTYTNALWSMTAAVTESGAVDAAAPFPGQAVAIPGPDAVSIATIGLTVDLSGTTLYAAWTKEGTTEVYYSTGTRSASGVLSWSTPALVPGISSSTGVSLFSYDYDPGGLWLGWADASSGNLRYASLEALQTGGSATPILLNGQPATSGSCPAFAVSQPNPEIIYVLWVGTAPGNPIHLASTSGGAWTQLADLPGATGNDHEPIIIRFPFPFHLS